eukprot:8416657-Pyramimonas_sp.AAC.1
MRRRRRRCIGDFDEGNFGIHIDPHRRCIDYAAGPPTSHLTVKARRPAPPTLKVIEEEKGGEDLRRREARRRTRRRMMRRRRGR